MCIVWCLMANLPKCFFVFFFFCIELFRHINRSWLKRKAVVRINNESDDITAEFFLANFRVTSPFLYPLALVVPWHTRPLFVKSIIYITFLGYCLCWLEFWLTDKRYDSRLKVSSKAEHTLSHHNANSPLSNIDYGFWDYDSAINVHMSPVCLRHMRTRL